MTDKLDRVRKAMKRRPDATRFDLTRETVEALLSEIDRLTEQRDNMVAAHALAQIREQNTRAALAAAPQPAPVDRETLVEVIGKGVFATPADHDAIDLASNIAHALLARGLRPPGADAEAERDAAFAAGQADMRERATAEISEWMLTFMSGADATDDVVAAIRDLPINPRP